MLRNIPSYLPDLALGQRWAKSYYSQALHQHASKPQDGATRGLQGLDEREAVVGRRVVAVGMADAAAHCRARTEDLNQLLKRKTELHGHFSGPWETQQHQERRQQWQALLLEEERLRRTVEQLSAEEGMGTIVATEGKPRLPDGAISVLWVRRASAWSPSEHPFPCLSVFKLTCCHLPEQWDEASLLPYARRRKTLPPRPSA